MTKRYTVFFYAILFTAFFGCCSSSTSTVTTMKDTTALFTGIRETKPLLQLNNYVFQSTSVDSSGDTSWVVTIRLDSTQGDTTSLLINPSVIANAIVGAFFPSKKKVGTTTVAVNPRDIAIKFPQTITTIKQEAWYEKLQYQIMIWLTIIIIGVVLVKQILK